MNLKLNNDVRTAHSPNLKLKHHLSSVKEERRRTGRYIAILVGICLFLLAIYHAWVRRIPVVASLVVPALIMFIYVGWVLYTASRDKHRLLDAEAARMAAECMEHEVTIAELTPRDLSIAPSKDSRRSSLTDEPKNTWGSNNYFKNKIAKEEEMRHFIKPIILVNDKPPDDSDLIWSQIIETVVNNEKFKGLQTRKKFKRKFCRSKRNAVFKRSYSIA